MDFTITLLANPAVLPLHVDTAHLMTGLFAMQGVRVQIEQILQPDSAIAFSASHSDGKKLATLTQQVLGDQPYDAIVELASAPRKKLLISDMDSTMITVECIDELADFVGKKAHVAAITERAMNGELDFAAALTERVALLAGLPETTLEQCYRERVRMMPGAKALVSHFKAAGGHCVLVSGGFTFFTNRVRSELGFDEDYSNQLEVRCGVLTGRVIPPILGKEAKLSQLEAQCQKLGITQAEVLAIGDGANDLPMLLAAGLGVAYRAKPTVRAQTSAQLNHCDLSALNWVL